MRERHLTDRLLKQDIPHVVGKCQEEHAPWILAAEQGSVKHVLAHGLLQRIDVRGTAERLDLHRDAQRALLRSEEPLCAEIDVKAPAGPRSAEADRA